MELSCHCGHIQLKVEQLRDTLTSCNCSIFHRYRDLWRYDLPVLKHGSSWMTERIYRLDLPVG